MPRASVVGSLTRPTSWWWREGALLATAFALCLVGGSMQLDDTISAPPVRAYLLSAAACAALPLRHRSPLAALAASTACGMLVAPLELLLTPLIITPVVIAAYVVALRSERRAAFVAVLLSAAFLVASTAVFGDLSKSDVARLGVVAAFPVVAGILGQSTQNRRAYLAAVEERAQRAEESRESEARRRVAEERVHIARELHDLVAHQITLANAQAMVAGRLFDTRPEQARRSVEELVETTRSALDDLRATVGLLRQAGDAAAPAEPAPALDRLPALLESFHRAGLEVSVQHEGVARPLPPGVDLTAYRIVQEALTNVAKHAGTTTARVSLAWSRDRLGISVSDDGRGGRPASSTSGYGLIGMRERAGAVGGELSAGRRPEGGFLVTAQLPIPPAAAAAQSPGAAGDVA